MKNLMIRNLRFPRFRQDGVGARRMTSLLLCVSLLLSMAVHGRASGEGDNNVPFFSSYVPSPEETAMFNTAFGYLNISEGPLQETAQFITSLRNSNDLNIVGTNGTVAVGHSTAIVSGCHDRNTLGLNFKAHSSPIELAATIVHEVSHIRSAIEENFTIDPYTFFDNYNGSDLSGGCHHALIHMDTLAYMCNYMVHYQMTCKAVESQVLAINMLIDVHNCPFTSSDMDHCYCIP